MAYVRLDRAFAQHQLSSDLTVRLAPPDQRRNFALTPGQTIGVSSTTGGVPGLSKNFWASVTAFQATWHSRSSALPGNQVVEA